MDERISTDTTADTSTTRPDDGRADHTRQRLVTVGVTVLVVVLLGLYAFVPRTLASGGADDTAWEVRVRPVGAGLSPHLTLHGPQGTTEVSGYERPFTLRETVVWSVGSGPDAETLVVGPTPPGATSVRLTTDARGVAEAGTVKVAWTRFHVEQLPGDDTVRELVAISDRGAVLDAVRDLPVTR